MSQTTGTKFSATIKFPHPCTIFGITIDGIQPLFFLGNKLHVIDRNMLTKIRAKKISEANYYWVSQLNSPNVTINPIFVAAEGTFRRTPTIDEFATEYFLAEKELKEHLPLAKLIPHTEKTVLASYALIEDLRERRARESEFLMCAAPLVAVRSSNREIISKETDILAIAASHGVIGGALSLLAVLSCLYENTSGAPASPARKVLKPKVNYTTQLAHNCLSDLMALELLIAGSSLGMGELAFISGDKNLGRFWQALGAKAGAPVDGMGSGTFRVTTRLLQRIDDEGLQRLQDALNR